jgi:septal ring-binding cell division protein DamX
LKRLMLLVVFLLVSLPLWADYGLSNVITKQIDRNQQKEQPPVAGEEMSAPVQAPRAEPASPSNTSPPVVPRFKKSVFYPYTIHISSWQTQKDAFAQYKQRYQKLEGVFITKIDLGPTGIWYRIDVGAYSADNEAIARMKDLQDAGVIDTESFIGSSVPYAIELGLLPDRDQAKKMADKLRREGVVTYIMKESDSAYRVLSGAFPSQKSAEPALNDLAALGLHTKITKR